MDLYLKERNNYYIHQERQASVLTRHQKKQKISNNEEATSTKITNTSKTPPILPLSPFQLEAMNRFIENSMALQFDLRPRMDQSGKKEINVSKMNIQYMKIFFTLISTLSASGKTFHDLRVLHWNLNQY